MEAESIRIWRSGGITINTVTPKYWGSNPPDCRFFHHKAHVDRTQKSASKRISQHSPWPNATEIFCDSQECGQINRYVVLIMHSLYFSTRKETKEGTFMARCAASCTWKLLPVIELDSQPLDIFGLHSRHTYTYLCLGASSEKWVRNVISSFGF
jgi:hypothetical protein